MASYNESLHLAHATLPTTVGKRPAHLMLLGVLCELRFHDAAVGGRKHSKGHITS